MTYRETTGEYLRQHVFKRAAVPDPIDDVTESGRSLCGRYKYVSEDGWPVAWEDIQGEEPEEDACKTCLNLLEKGKTGAFFTAREGIKLGR